MTIGIAGPMTLSLIDMDWTGKEIPKGYAFPFTAYLINELLNRGVKVVAYTFSSGIEEPVVFKDDRITVCVGRIRKHPGRSFFSFERKDLVNLMKKHPADLINAQWSYEFAMASLSTGIPTVVTVRDHSLTIWLYFKDAYRFVKMLMNFKVLTKTKYIITNSKYLKQLLSKRARKKARVIPNFYQGFLESFYKPEKKISKTIISICSGFDDRKNVKNGLRAFQLFRKEFPEYTYKLIGGGMEKNGPAYQFAIENNLSDNVEFMGYVPFQEVIKILSESDVLLHPSREESFGNTILEALVVGTIVVAGEKSGNVPYLLDHGRVGFLCDVNSAEGIKKSLVDSVTKDNLVSLREEGFNFAKNNYSSDIVVEKLIATYKEIIERSN